MTVSVNNGSAFVGNAVALPKSVASDEWPGSTLIDTVDLTTSTFSSTTAVASATPHTVGSWVPVDANLSADAAGVILWVTTSTSAPATDTSTLLNFGIGGAGSETIWATTGIGYLFTTGGLTPSFPIIIPGFIAAGTRTAIQVQSAIVSQSVSVRVEFIPATKGQNPGVPVTYQANTATSRGLTITAPGALNTKGAWIEIVSSTATALSALGVHPQAAGNTALPNSGVLIDIGTGALGQESVIISNLYLNTDTSERVQTRSLMTRGLLIPAGSRISARYARQGSTATIDLIVVGTTI